MRPSSPHDYRSPEKATLIIVGDVDVESVERAIEDRFSGWEHEADAGSAKTQRTLPASDGTIEVMIDPDHKDTELIVATLSPSVAAQTESDFRTYLVRTVVSCFKNDSRHFSTAGSNRSSAPWRSHRRCFMFATSTCFLWGAARTGGGKSWRPLRANCIVLRRQCAQPDGYRPSFLQSTSAPA